MPVQGNCYYIDAFGDQRWAGDPETSAQGAAFSQSTKRASGPPRSRATRLPNPIVLVRNARTIWRLISYVNGGWRGTTLGRIDFGAHGCGSSYPGDPIHMDMAATMSSMIRGRLVTSRHPLGSVPCPRYICRWDIPGDPSRAPVGPNGARVEVDDRVHVRVAVGNGRQWAMGGSRRFHIRATLGSGKLTPGRWPGVSRCAVSPGTS